MTERRPKRLPGPVTARARQGLFGAKLRRGPVRGRTGAERGHRKDVPYAFHQMSCSGKCQVART
jgi:hypothetical protein